MPTTDSIVSACQKFAQKFGTPKNVYYPGCGDDTSPFVAFPNSTVVFLDPDEHCIAAIRKEHPTAVTVCMKAEDVLMGARYDLVLDMHSHAPFIAEIRDLRMGGYLLIANKGSDKAFELPVCQLVGVFRWKTGRVVDGVGDIEVNDLEQYKEVDPYSTSPFTNKRKYKAAYYVFRKMPRWS